MAYDRTRQETLMFGGLAPGQPFAIPLDDTWLYRSGPWAEFAPVGTGCASSAGVPRMEPAPGQLPWLGQSFTVRVGPVGTGPFSLPVMLIGASPSTWGGLRLPLDLGSLGMPGCVLYNDIVVTSAIPRTGSTVSWVQQIPSTPALRGQPFYLQALVLDPFVNAFGAVVSNGAACRVQER